MRHLVPQEFKELKGEGLVLGFGLLQGEHIDFGFIEPVLDAVGAGANGVHVPGSNLHVHQLTVCALPHTSHSLMEKLAVFSNKPPIVCTKMEKIAIFSI